MEHKAAAAQFVFILSILRFLKYLYAPLAPSSDDPRAALLEKYYVQRLQFLSWRKTTNHSGLRYAPYLWSRSSPACKKWNKS
ncbi:hypothetical protein ACPOL_2739 [Acidisarcina polymorpha]|uniref:Uncharacterized protein n=1 Tax=Acidisarcina polymorpha TaxID=2211140 RepID=A0A2Z5FZ27_9BACT|nr:hypothetical protein ACPOL_2739 [Acidisarcina polymorpha]